MAYEELKITSEKSSAEVIIPVHEADKIREELIGIHSINSLTHHNSSQRNYMMSSHFSQAMVIPDGDPHILQTGVDNQLAKYTFAAEVEKKSRVLKVINKYSSVDDNYVDVTTQKYVLVITEDNELDVIIVDNNHSGFHQNTGFQYKWSKKLLNLKRGTILEKGEKLAYSPALKEGGYAFGRNVNVVMMGHPDVAEDGVVISESLSKKLRYHVFEKRVVSFGTEYFPLNLYGDENNYRAFPEIGEMVNQDSVLIALRSFDNLNLNKTGEIDLTPGLLSVTDTMSFDPEFDKCVYVKGPGEMVDIGDGRTEPSGIVVDINVYKNDKKIPKLRTDADNIIEKYHNSYLKFSRDFLDAYDQALDEHKGLDIKISPRLQQLVVHFGLIDYEYNVERIKNHPRYAGLYRKMVTQGLPGKISTSYKNEKLDTYRIEFTVRYTVNLIKGNKITDLNGGKGVVIKVMPDELMPYNEYGRAEMIVDSSSSISRMNMARLYQPYFCGASRFVQYNLRNMANGRDIYTIPENEVESMYRYLMGFLGKFATEQFDAYAQADELQKREILNECLTEEVFVMHKVTSEKKAYQIQRDIENSEYAPPHTKIIIPTQHEDGTITYDESEEKIYIAPLYTMVLNKNADNMSYNSSPDLNIFKFPNTVSSINKDKLPYRRSPIRSISETEYRLYTVTGGRRGIGELKDRANSVPTHMAIYNNILRSDNPTDVNDIVNRKINKFGQDSGIKLVESTFKMLGLDFEYFKEGN